MAAFCPVLVGEKTRARIKLYLGDCTWVRKYHTIYTVFFLRITFSVVFLPVWIYILRLLADLGRRYRHFGCGIVVNGGWLGYGHAGTRYLEVMNVVGVWADPHVTYYYRCYKILCLTCFFFLLPCFSCALGLLLFFLLRSLSRTCLQLPIVFRGYSVHVSLL